VRVLLYMDMSRLLSAAWLYGLIQVHAWGWEGAGWHVVHVQPWVNPL
jgi:hypothetical protein